MIRLTKPKLARLERGLSQYEVERKTGIFQSLVSLYERGLRKPPDPHKEILSRLYQKSPEELGWN